MIAYYIELVELEKGELNLLVEKIPEVMKTEFVSLADRLREEGRVETLERKNCLATENMLRKGYKVSEICEVQDVTPEFVEKVRKAMKN